MIIFTRITRTGTTSFWHGVKDNFNGGKTCWQKEDFAKEQYRKIGGLMKALADGRKFKLVPDMFSHHLPYGVHKLFSTNDYHYLAFLREPISRTISAIKFAQALTYDKAYDHFLETTNFFRGQLFLQGFVRDIGRTGDDESVGLLLENCLKAGTCCNVMTKQLSGMEKPFDIQSTYAWPSGNIYSINHTTRYYTKKEMKVLLQAAKDNLATYSFVGFQENGIADHKKACIGLGLSYHNHSVIYKGYEILPPLADADWQYSKTQELLCEMNEFDIELYDFARKNDYEYKIQNSN